MFWEMYYASIRNFTKTAGSRSPSSKRTQPRSRPDVSGKCTASQGPLTSETVSCYENRTMQMIIESSQTTAKRLCLLRGSSAKADPGFIRRVVTITDPCDDYP